MSEKLDQATINMIQNLENKTGKSFNEWLSIAKSNNLKKHIELLNWLKSEFGLTYGYANLVALKALESPTLAAADDPEALLLNAQYAGAKAALRPIYDAVITAVQNFGDDVEISPKKTYVSLRRGKQFAIVQPSTKTRLDVGINLKGIEPTDRLELSGSFNSMVSHRVRLKDVSDVDHELLSWLKMAYEAA